VKKVLRDNPELAEEIEAKINAAFESGKEPAEPKEENED